MKGYIYVIGNPEFKRENLYKVGYTERCVEDRVKDLSTGVPGTYEIHYKQLIDKNCHLIERFVHKRLAIYLFGKEFFQAPLETIIKAITDTATLHDGTFSLFGPIMLKDIADANNEQLEYYESLQPYVKCIWLKIDKNWHFSLACVETGLRPESNSKVMLYKLPKKGQIIENISEFELLCVTKASVKRINVYCPLVVLFQHTYQKADRCDLEWLKKLEETELISYNLRREYRTIMKLFEEKRLDIMK